MTAPDVPQKAPYVIEVEPGTYAWCSCGKSQRQPYCDGSHGGTSLLPKIEKVTRTSRLAWCGCKHSKTAPFCDGSHGQL